VGGKIKAITFDLWDTIVHDDSDEPKRKAQGLRSKKEERRHLLWAALNAEAPIDPSAVTLAYDVADAAFNKTWHDQHVTWTIGERLLVALKGLKRELPAAAFAEVVRRHEDMEVEIRPDLIPGIVDSLALGLDYYTLDRILWGLDRGWSEQKIADTLRVTIAQIKHVQEMWRRSDHMRRLPPVPDLD